MLYLGYSYFLVRILLKGTSWLLRKPRCSEPRDIPCIIRHGAGLLYVEISQPQVKMVLQTKDHDYNTGN